MKFYVENLARIDAKEEAIRVQQQGTPLGRGCVCCVGGWVGGCHCH